MEITDNQGRKTRVEYDLLNLTAYHYDPEGLRYEMEENGNLVQFIFNQNREAVTEEDNTGLTRLIRSTELIARSTDAVRTYYHYASDEMGSTTHIVDENGNVQNRYEYDTWGNLTLCEEKIPNRFKYTGQQIDPVTQQYYLRARFYNPVIARFTQEDTYRGDGLNLYTYCANNPTYYTDLSGHQPNCVKDAAARYIAEGMSTEDAYRRAYAEHARWKLNDPSISPKEKADLIRRAERLGMDVPKSAHSPDVPEAEVPRTPESLIAERAKDLDLTPHSSNMKQLSKKKMRELQQKKANRTITKEEYKLLEWNKKIRTKRRNAVDSFWAEERERIVAGTATRNWSKQQVQQIMEGRTPKFDGKPIQGHHAYSVSQYPHLAARHEIIFPATFNEHFNGWHGGNFSISLPGIRINEISDF